MVRSLGKRVATGGLCVVLMAAAGCSSQGVIGGSQETVVVTETVSTVPAQPPVQGGVGATGVEVGEGAGVPAVSTAAAPGVGRPELESVVRAAQGVAGVAVTAVGGRGDVRTAGAWQTGVAWSTIKVPLAVAAARVDPGVLEASAHAITGSDNQAAEGLWASLGGGAAAASAVGTVLADGGDTVTQVPSVHTRDGYSIFGQTLWSLADQASFGGVLPCLGASARVMDLMAQVSPDQRWGLGRIPGARFKGGWGPGEGGGYLVRQFGTVPASGGDVAVAIAVDAPSFEAGAAALSRMADSLAPQLPSIPGGVC